VKSGKFGPYLQRGEGGPGHTASIPEHIAPGDLTLEKAIEILATPQGPQELGKDEATGLGITLRNGRFGPYVQLGEDNEETKKKAKKIALTYGPKRIPIMPGLDPSAVTLEQAKTIISLPRKLGEIEGEAVTVSLGRFGPYIKKGTDFRSVPKEKDLFTITFAEAEAILKEEKKGRGRKATVLKELGVDPKTEKPVQVLDGKYGPYISNGTRVFVSLPKDVLPEDMTLEKAVAMLEEKAPTKAKRKTKTRTKKKKE
jgi:DNA topoisomerase-1